MRIGIISDIHGNFQALKAVLTDGAAQHLDLIISLGDNIGYGPEPERVTQQLIKNGIASVMGNHELALVSPGYLGRLNFITAASLTITQTLLSSASRAWLAALPPFMIKEGVRFVHGCPPGSITSYLFKPSEVRIKRLFQSYPEWLTFAGHTHTLCLIATDSDNQSSLENLKPGRQLLAPTSRYIVIPGSVGQPRDTIDNTAKYGIFDSSDHRLEIRAVSYDVSKTIDKLKALGFPMQNWKRLQ